jgi:hypothetical protein
LLTFDHLRLIIEEESLSNLWLVNKLSHVVVGITINLNIGVIEEFAHNHKLSIDVETKFFVESFICTLESVAVDDGPFLVVSVVLFPLNNFLHFSIFSSKNV